MANHSKSNPDASLDKLASIGKDTVAQAFAMAKEEFLTCLFICIAEDDQYKELKMQLVNQFVFRTDRYLVNLTAAFALLKNFKSSKAKNNNSNRHGSGKKNHQRRQQGKHRSGVRPGQEGPIFHLWQDKPPCKGFLQHDAQDLREAPDRVA